jgi:hypothetical protein
MGSNTGMIVSEWQGEQRQGLLILDAPWGKPGTAYYRGRVIKGVSLLAGGRQVQIAEQI